METVYDTVIIGDPYHDRSVVVEPAFLAKHGLKEGSATAADEETVNAVWKDANPGEYKSQRGGSGFHVFEVLARLHKCVLIGRVGPESFRELDEYVNSIGTSLLKQGTLSTGMVNCFVTRNRTMQTSVGVSKELCEEDILPHLSKGLRHLHVEGYVAYRGDLLNKVVKQAKDVGMQISLDLGNETVVEMKKEVFESCLEYVDILCGDRAAMLKLTGQKTLQRAVESFTDTGIAVATDGANGCWVKWKEETGGIHYDPPKIDNVVDPTGAGDFWLAGFLDGILSGLDRKECIRRANLAASFVLPHEGADLEPEVWKQLVVEMRAPVRNGLTASAQTLL